MRDTNLLLGQPCMCMVLEELRSDEYPDSMRCKYAERCSSLSEKEWMGQRCLYRNAFFLAAYQVDMVLPTLKEGKAPPLMHSNVDDIVRDIHQSFQIARNTSARHFDPRNGREGNITDADESSSIVLGYMREILDLKEDDLLYPLIAEDEVVA